jgi:hypothetical protein
MAMDKPNRSSDSRHPDDEREDRVHGRSSGSEVGGEDHVRPAPDHDGPPRDERSREPLGPITPDPGRPLGDTAEAHDEITPADLPLGHPGRKEAERLAREHDGTTRGNL